MRLAPTLVEAFQSDILVASSPGANQWVIRRAQGGNPMPWNQPLNIQSRPKAATVELRPKPTFSSAERPSPSTRKARALQRSPRKPLANFDTP